MEKIILVTGSPGAGKSFLIKNLYLKLKDLGYKIVKISASKRAFEKNLIVAYDVERDTHIIDYENLKKTLEEDVKRLSKKENHIIIIESTDPCIIRNHHVDLVIVVKCDPEILKRRLEERKWPKLKIEENVDAEYMGIIYNEALKCFDKSKVLAVNLTKLDEVGTVINDIVFRITHW